MQRGPEGLSDGAFPNSGSALHLLYMMYKYHFSFLDYFPYYSYYIIIITLPVYLNAVFNGTLGYTRAQCRTGS